MLRIGPMWIALALSLAACGSSDDDGRPRDGGSGGTADAGDDADAGCTGSCEGDGGSGSGTGGSGTFPLPGFRDQSLAVSADGTTHLLFTDGASQYVSYGRCALRCGDPASWNVVRLLSATEAGLTTLGAAGIGVDGSGRLHALIDGVPPYPSIVHSSLYATCATACSLPESWTAVDLSPVLGGRNTIGTVRTFMVEANGRVSFLTPGAGGSSDAWYVRCDGSCTVPSNWTGSVAFSGNPLHARRDPAGVVHAMVHGGTSAGGGRLFKYARCSSACGVPGSWTMSTLGFRHGSADHAAGFAVADDGRVYMGYQQGVLSPVDDADRTLVVRTCVGAGCMDLGTWQSLAFGDADEGQEGVDLVTSGESVLLASTTFDELRVTLCANGGCEQAASWTAAIVADTSDAIAQSIAPDTASACPGSATFAAWYPQRPVLAVAPGGVLGFHNPYRLVTCPGQTSASRLAPIGRVLSEF